MNNELMHYGIPGMKWGVRRFETASGHLTAAGKKRYDKDVYDAMTRNSQLFKKAVGYKESSSKFDKAKYVAKSALQSDTTKNLAKAAVSAAVDKTAGSRSQNKTTNHQRDEQEYRRAKVKKAIKIGAAVVGAAVATYGAYKMSKYVKDKAFTKAYSRGVKATASYMEKWAKENASGLGKKSYNEMNNYLINENYEYAKRASKSIVAAVKTLMNENREMPLAELKNMGIHTVDPAKIYLERTPIIRHR